MATLVSGATVTEAIPFVWNVAFTTDAPTSASVVITGGSGERLIEFSDFSTSHQLPLFGLKADTEYQIDIVFRDSTGNTSVAALDVSVHTDPLTGGPTINVIESNPDLMEPGYTLLTSERILDNDGDVVYAGRNVKELNILSDPQDIQDLSDALGVRFDPYSIVGIGIGGTDSDEIVVADLLGNRVVIADFDDNSLGPLHHDVQLTERNTLLTFGRVSYTAESFPASPTDPTLVSGVVLEDEPLIEVGLDGTILNVWYMHDILDTQRAAYDSWNPAREGLDWLHCNAVLEVPGEDAFIVSARNQDAVFKFTRDGELVWILGNHENWGPEFQQYLLTPVGQGFSWQYHQHAPELTPDGDLLVFDNGNEKASPYDGTTPLADDENWSRAVRYHIDEATMTVSQVWEYDAEKQLYSSALGDADELPTTGNILVDYGWVRFEGGVSSSDLGKGRLHTHIIEVTGGDDPQVVFHVEIFNPDGSEYRNYRAERIPSLYNSSVTETELDGYFLGGDAADGFAGDVGRQFALGLGGDDTLSGRAGEDTLDGGEGDDSLAGGDDNDLAFGGNGDDVMNGGAGDDVMSGGDGADFLSGRSGSDGLSGGDGDDSLKGNEGDDTLEGGGGDDSLTGNEGDDELSGGDGDDVLLGGDGDDLLSGRTGDDSLSGGRGDDSLKGNDGDDTLDGGNGSDILNGGAGGDMLVFATTRIAGAVDVVVEFVAGEDLVDLRAFTAADLIDDFADVQALFEDIGGSTLLRLSTLGGDDVRFAGLAITTLNDEANFLLL